jgi:hypothetical protein
MPTSCCATCTAFTLSGWVCWVVVCEVGARGVWGLGSFCAAGCRWGTDTVVPPPTFGAMPPRALSRRRRRRRQLACPAQGPQQQRRQRRQQQTTTMPQQRPAWQGCTSTSQSCCWSRSSVPTCCC